MEPIKPRAGIRIIGVAASPHPSGDGEQMLAVHYEQNGSEFLLEMEHAQAISLLVNVDQLIQRFGRSNLAKGLGGTLAALKRPPGKRQQ